MILKNWLPPRMASALSEIDWDRALIFVRALVAIWLFLYSVWWIHVHLVSARIPIAPLSLAISFLGVQFGVILGELIASCSVKKLDEIRHRRSRQWRPLIQRALAAQLAGKDASVELKRCRKRWPRETEMCLVELLTSVNGQVRRRLSELALDLRLVKRWERRAKLGRRELNEAIEWLGLLSPEIGSPVLWRVLNAARYSLESRWLPRAPAPAAHGSKLCSQLRLADPAELEGLCREILAGPRLVRTMAAGELRTQTRGLGASAVFGALSGSQTGLFALQLTESWRSSVPAGELVPLFRHESAAVRGLALRLTPFQAAPRSFETEVLNCLQGGLRAAPDDPGAQHVIAGALSAVARLRLTRALPYVAECASSSNPILARMACSTLAALGEPGRAVLESKIHEGPSQQAGRAAESLMSLRAGRLPAGGF